MPSGPRLQKGRHLPSPESGNQHHDRRPLRFGVMCNSTAFESWQVSCLEKLFDRDGVELHLLIVNETAREGGFRALKRVRLREFLFQVYTRLFMSTVWVDLSGQLAGVPAIHCKTVMKGRYSQYFSEPDIQTIRSHDLDFILRFGFNIIRGEILQAARYGVWSFHHGDEEKYRGRPAGFWELFDDEPVTGAILQRLTDRLDGGIILRKGWIGTLRHSYARQHHSLHRMSTVWPDQVCVDIQNGCADYLNNVPVKTDAPVYTAPTNRQMGVFLCKMVGRMAHHVFDRLFMHARWNIGIVNAPISAFLDPGFTPDVTWFECAEPGKFFADPFLVRYRDQPYVLFEKFDIATRRGLIAFQQLDGERKSGVVQGALETPQHLSYPFVFEHDEEIYCIPESAAANEIALYKAIAFPDSWSRVTTLVDGFAGLDTSIFHHDGRWWLACGSPEGAGVTHLYIFHADDLPGPWQAHAGNPVKIDICSARPAGTPFVVNGKLYRPAQDCSRTYGGRVVINHVTRLSPTEFDEETAMIVAPDPAGPCPDGLHTIAGVGDITVIDGKKTEFVTRAAWSVIRRNFARILKRSVSFLGVFRPAASASSGVRLPPSGGVR